MKGIVKLGLVASGALCAATVHAATGDFACRNATAEITCTAARCEVNTDGFTPMSISRSGNRLEVCAYSGCWGGPLDLIRTRGDITLLHAMTDGSFGPAAVNYDRKQRIATLMWSNYAMPLNCGPAE